MSVVHANALHRLRDAARRYAPTIAGSFVSFVLSSQQSLRIWIALQKTTTPSPLNVLVPLIALYLAVCRGLRQSKLVLSKWLIAILAVWSIVLASAAIIWVALVTKYNIHLTYEQKLKIAETINNFNSISLYWSKWIAPTFLAISLSPLIRFHYRNHSEASFDTDKFDNLAVFQSQKPSDGGLPSVRPGISLSESMPRNFAKPYFHITISTWLLTQSVCIAMGFFIDSNFVIPRMILSIPISLLVTITFVMIVAVAEKDVGKLWRYTKLWTVPPTDAEVQGAVAAVQPLSDLEEESKEKSGQLPSIQ